MTPSLELDEKAAVALGWVAPISKRGKTIQQALANLVLVVSEAIQ